MFSVFLCLFPGYNFYKKKNVTTLEPIVLRPCKVYKIELDGLNLVSLVYYLVGILDYLVGLLDYLVGLLEYLDGLVGRTKTLFQ